MSKDSLGMPYAGWAMTGTSQWAIVCPTQSDACQNEQKSEVLSGISLAQSWSFEEFLKLSPAKLKQGITYMLSAIIIREIFESIYSYRFLFFLIIGATLIPIGMHANRVSYSNRLNDYYDQARMEKQAILSAQSWELMSGNLPIKGFLEPAPLAVFAQGLESSLPQFYTFKPGGYESGRNSPDERSSVAEFGILDFAFIVQLVFSLIALIFGADVISGEKELGTLRSVLSNSVPRDSILLGKLIGGFVAIWFPFALALMLGLLVLGVSPFPLYNEEILTRIPLIFMASSIFLLIYFSLGIMISSSTSRARTSLIAVIVVWTFLQLIIPKVAGMTAALIHPIKAETVLSMEKSVALHTLEDERAREMGIQFQRIFGKDTALAFSSEPSREKNEWASYREETVQRYREKEAARVHSLDEADVMEKETQQRIASAFSFLSPSASFGFLINDLCGTGTTDRKKVSDAVIVYQQSLDRRLFGLFTHTPINFPNGRTMDILTITKFMDAGSLPTFYVQRASLGEIFSNNVVSVFSLAFWSIFPFAIAYKLFLKYDVR